MAEQAHEDIYDPEYHQYFELVNKYNVAADLEGYVPKPQIDFTDMTIEEKNALKYVKNHQHPL